MYIKKLKTWENKDWDNYFKQFPLVRSEESKEIIKRILTYNTKQEIEQEFYKLEMFWVINWIWPASLYKYARLIISYIFAGVRYEWHDIDFGIGGNMQDFHRANYWLIKYSFITIAKNIQYIMIIDINRLFKLLFLLFSFPFFLIQITIAFFCYIMVEFYGKVAFRFSI